MSDGKWHLLRGVKNVGYSKCLFAAISCVKPLTLLTKDRLVIRILHVNI